MATGMVQFYFDLTKEKYPRTEKGLLVIDIILSDSIKSGIRGMCRFD